jgi:hypothetical protein
MSENNPTSKAPIGAVPAKLTGFLCPHCLVEIKVGEDIGSFTFPTPARGVGIMFVVHTLCHKPIPFLLMPLPPADPGSN